MLPLCGPTALASWGAQAARTANLRQAGSLRMSLQADRDGRPEWVSAAVQPAVLRIDQDGMGRREVGVDERLFNQPHPVPQSSEPARHLVGQARVDHYLRRAAIDAQRLHRLLNAQAVIEH